MAHTFEKILLRGLTRKGKNRITQHGAEYWIQKTGEFDGRPAILVQNHAGDMRWVHLQGDAHFEIVKRWSVTRPTK